MAEDIGLLDELLADSRPTDRGCKVCAWLEDRHDAAEWDSAFQNDAVTISAIVRKMRSLGYAFQDKTAHIHRTKKHRVD